MKTIDSKLVTLLQEIQTWMVDNDYEYGEIGSDIYDQITTILNEYSEDEESHYEEEFNNEEN